MQWTVVYLNDEVRREVEGLSMDLRAILHAFVMKTEKTPRCALEIARARVKEVR